jgi:arylsulfatase A
MKATCDRDTAGRSPLCEGSLSAALVVCVACFCTVSTQTRASIEGKPNFVFILIDDLGWADVGCYGSTFHETPNIDRLAQQGMRFTNAYAACPVCSPTRASIMTGRYPARLHLTDYIPGHKEPFAKLCRPEFRQELPLEEVTLAEALKPAGYVSACIGKWHLGGEPFFPEKQGFDLNFGGSNSGHPPSYFYPYRLPGVGSGRPGEYLTDRLTNEAEDFIAKNKDRPFFLYFAHYAVHTPLQAKQEMVARYQRSVKPGSRQKNPIYAAMIQSVDESVGRITAKLDELNIADRTIVFFMSDNGGLASVTSNAPLRAGKGTMYEGGIREPLIVRWPGAVRPGATCDVPVISTDFFPTMLEMVGLKPDPARTLDGVSIGPLLKGTGAVRRDALYWHYPHYHPGGATPCGAVRQGDYKLIEFYENGRLELYNLKEDVGEANDLAGKMPDKAAELRMKLGDWRHAVDAQMPTTNPRYDPSKPLQRIKQPALGQE